MKARCVHALLCAWFMSGLVAESGQAETLRVGTSGDYAPFSVKLDGDPPGFEGFDSRS